MRLNPMGSNMNSVNFPDGTEVLFSYRTPVAALLPSGEFVRTSRKWSKTTSKHIKQWLQGRKAREVEQSIIEAIASK